MFLTNKMKTLPAWHNNSSLFASALVEYQGKRPTKSPQKSIVHSIYLLVGTGLYRVSPSIWLTLDSNPYRLICLGILEYTGSWDLPVSLLGWLSFLDHL